MIIDNVWVNHIYYINLKYHFNISSKQWQIKKIHLEGYVAENHQRPLMEVWGRFYMYVRTYIHAYIHTYIHTCIHTYIRAYIHT